MPCLLCGDICRCSSDAYSDASPRWLPDEDACAAETAEGLAPATPKLKLEPSSLRSSEERTLAGLSEAVSNEQPVNEAATGEASAWRQEVAARLTRYHARRKPRPPRYPSLRLRFEAEDSGLASDNTSFASPEFSPGMTTSNQALALDRFAVNSADVLESPVRPSTPAAEPRDVISLFPATDPILHPAASNLAGTFATTAKIIEFPRSWTPAPAPLDELAEPVLNRDRPRILEAPEIVPPLPALGGITIEPAPQPELEKRPGIDFPLQSVPLARRILCAAIDGLIIAAACALFGFIFWKMTAIRPPRIQLIGIAAGLFAAFWAAYEYLLVVYSGSTPGLRLAGLDLVRFDGSPARRRVRRWRVLASFLSAASLGMGYAWALLDEDALCWHDRITHTYLAPKRREPAENLAQY